MKYGHFDDKAREYVIDTPRTPYPWINYLGCEQFFGIISNTAGGYCFYRDARLRRVTRYRYNNMPVDNAAATSTSRMATRSGIPAGSPSKRSWTAIPAVTAWATPSSPVRRTV